MPHNIITITADNISNVIGELIFDPANDDHGLMIIVNKFIGSCAPVDEEGNP